VARSIFFHGALGQKYGRRHELEVTSAREAARCFVVQVPGFREDLEAGAYRIVRKSPGAEVDLGEVDLDFQLGRAPELHFYPILTGGKDRGVGKIILGVALVAVAFGGAGAARAAGKSVGRGFGESALGGAFGGAVTFGAIGSLGAALLLGGISQTLAPTPRVDGYGARADERPSFLFNGPVNVGAQGVAVPVVYGRMRVGSVVVSAGLTTENIPV